MKPLPFPGHALEPFMSSSTIDCHYRHHHAGYVNALNRQVEDSPFSSYDLQRLIRVTADDPELQGIFRNAAQAWNHTLFWDSMRPDGGGRPKAGCAGLIADAFTSYDDFRDAFVRTGMECFGSGWLWVAYDGTALKVLSTPGARPVQLDGAVPLLTCDVWEHAYYLDHQYQRHRYLETFLDRLVNWDAAEHRLAMLGEFETRAPVRNVRRTSVPEPVGASRPSRGMAADKGTIEADEQDKRFGRERKH